MEEKSRALESFGHDREFGLGAVKPATCSARRGDPVRVRRKLDI